MDSRDTVDRLFDPTFNSCRDDDEFQLAWAVQSRLHEVMKRSGKNPPPLRDMASIRRRQAAERRADERLEEQHERAGRGQLFTFEDGADPVHAAVRAEVPDSVRRDGWTADRRIQFLELLDEHGSIHAAARAVGMSRRAVYRLLPRAPAFAAALSRITATLADTLFDRALNGHEVPIVHQGDVVATRTVHHDMLGLHLLRMRDPLNFAPPADGERWLAGHGLKPLGRTDHAPALSPPDSPAPDTPPTGDLCDLRSQIPAGLDSVAAGNQTPAGLRRSVAGSKDSPACVPSSLPPNTPAC